MTDTESRAAIMEAARSVLDVKGYRGFSIEAVSVRAGVVRAEIDRLWTGADDLLIDVLAEAMVIKKIPNLGNSRGELSIVVDHMISRYNDWARFEPALLAFAADHAGDQAVLEQLRQRCIQRSRTRIGAAIRRAADRGDLPPDVDSDLVQDVWAGAIAYRRLVSGDSLSVSLVNKLLDMVLSGMAPIRAPDWPTEQPEYVPPPEWLRESATWLSQQDLGAHHRLRDGVPVKALRRSRPTVTIAGLPVTVTAHASRDFMPGDNDNTTALMVTVTVSAAGPGGLPPFLHADRIAVLHEEEVWVAPVVENNPRDRTSRSFVVGAGPGPLWETDTKVDVVVQLLADQVGPQLVQAPNVRIRSTE